MKKSFYIIPLLFINIYGAGGAPMMTNGTGTPQKDQWELNFSWSASQYNSQKYSYTLPIVDINYGVTENLQLKVQNNFVRIKDEIFKDSGLGTTEAGFKWRFYDKDGLSFAVYPQYVFASIKKNITSGVAEEKSAITLPFLMHREFDTFGVTAAITYIGSEDKKSFMKSGVLLNYALNDKLELLGEVYRNARFDAKNQIITLNGGCTYSFYQNINGLFSIGKEIVKASEQKSTVFYIGLQLLF